MRSNLFFLLSFIFFISISNAQNGNGIIYGKVIDAISRQPVPGATIAIVNTTFGNVADENGDYRITSLPLGTYQVKVTSIGYDAVVKSDVVVNFAKPIELNFELRESVLILEKVTISADYFQRDPSEVISITNFSYEEIRRSPGGFEDVIRALSILPGVAQADAGRNDLIVRGGAPSENLYTIDGLVVPNINHFGSQGATGGPLSFVNLDFVKETSFSTGGFSVLYGDKLSSVLNINLREGRNDHLGGKGTISATQFGLNIEGPVSKNSNFIFSARRSYLDWIFKAAGFGFVPEYYDVLSKYSLSFDNHNSLSFLFLAAFDNVRYFNNTADQRFNNSRVLGSDQTNYVTGVTYRHLFKDGFYTLVLSRNYNDFNSSQRDSMLNPVFLNISREQENTLKGDLVYKLTSKSEINIGGSVKMIKFNADVKIPFFKTTFGDILQINNLKTKNIYTKSDLYVQYSNIIFDQIHFNLGLRSDYFNGIKDKFSFSPRVSASYRFNDLTSINFATGLYSQSPSYIWLAGDEQNKNLKTVKVIQYILGFEHRLEEDLNFKVEGFYKNYKDYPASVLRPYLVLANTGAGFSGADDNFSQFGLEPLLSAGKGFSRGVEISLQKKSSRIPLYGLLGLTIGESFFTSIDGIKRIGRYDQSIILNLTGGYIFNDKWEASARFRFATGSPYTPFNSDGTQSVDKINSERLKANHILDIRVDRRWNFNNWTLITYLDIQNIYNNKIQNSVRWDSRKKEVDNTSSIGILPSIGISAEF